MSTCPKNDIHSLYIDNELPEQYRVQFEEHIASCEKCRTKLNKEKQLHSLFQADKEDFHFTQKDLDDSFNRLQARLSYQKITGKAPARKNYKIPAAIGSFAAGVAAAAVLVFVVPSKSSQPVQNPGFQPVARTSMYAPVNQVSYGSSISPEYLTSMFQNGHSENAYAYPTMSVKPENNEQFYNFASYDIFNQIPGIGDPHKYNMTGNNNTFTSIPVSSSEISNSDFLFNVDSAYNYTNYFTGN